MKHRTCILEPVGLSEKEGTVQLSKETVTTNGGGNTIKVFSLSSLLEKHGVEKVDLWSLDIEGYEQHALGGMDLEKYGVAAILMEQSLSKNNCFQMPIDYRLTTRGYHKYRIVSDGLYIKAGSEFDFPRSELRFPDVALLDEYFLDLEAQKHRCGNDLRQDLKLLSMRGNE